jgi:hypothetical protein
VGGDLFGDELEVVEVVQVEHLEIEPGRPEVAQHGDLVDDLRD